ncbi:hypothetical protein ABIB25_004859 [Nakamurella sp. UYEF19]|uniref:hypothetical protein n=1 Tax=Nakamurella sp. UYEF19 TaxID=1756392 RepID=UPI003393A1F3
MSLAAFTEFNQDPAELTGHGFLPAHLALAMKTSIRTLAVIVVNEQGQAMAVGSTAPVPTYIPTQTVTDQVLTAAGTCRFPSCRIPGPLCDLDHRESFDHEHPERGGQTDAKSLDPLSRHHHFLKTFTDWTATRSPDDGLTMLWTSPTGHHYVDHPKEFAIPDHERPDPADENSPQETTVGSDADTDDHDCCPCARPSPVILDGGSTAQSHAEQTKILIARRHAAEPRTPAC